MSKDIRLDVGFLNNLKTRKMIRDIGDMGVVCVLRLWSYAAERHPKGILTGLNVDDLEDVAGWSGIRGVFAEYTIRTRWVDQSADGILSIHDWKEHQPWVYFSDKRKKAAKDAINTRWERFRNQAVNTGSNTGSNTTRNTPFPFPSPLPLDQRQDQKSCTRVKTTRFTPPTYEEVATYCAEKGSSVDPLKFHAFYTSNGWKVGKNPMKKWKAAIATWERR